MDDDADLLRLLSLRLQAAGYATDTAESARQALARLDAARPALVITDLRMTGMDGLALFDVIHERHPALPVIVLTAHGSIPEAVAATRRGVFAFLTKPFDGAELLEQVARALRLGGAGQGPAADGRAWRAAVITRSPLMQELLDQVALVAEGDASVLVLGESGTGKELIARALHEASARHAGPFVAFNCAAIPEQLLESELFGHTRGAFTGALRDHPGLFQTARGGTLLLDEIGDMPLALQAKLLRVLQERQVRAVGATQPVAVDVRIVAATHRDLESEVRASRFRADLYYRLNVVTLDIPPLARRREDIAPLAVWHLRRLAAGARKRVEGYAPEALELLVAAPWPGNVRQLLNVVEQCYTLATTPLIPETLVRKALREQPAAFPTFDDARARFELDYLVRVLKITGGNVTQAAELAGRNRTDFYKLLRRHDLDPAGFKGEP